MTKGYCNIFTPDDLTEQIDRARENLGLKSRTEVVRLGQKILERWIEHAMNNEHLSFFTTIQQIKMIDLQNQVGDDKLPE